MSLEQYRKFIAAKKIESVSYGFESKSLSGVLKHHQRVATDFALAKGRAALFLDTGLGKTLCELEFARECAIETGKPSLVLTPLAVAPQMVREGQKFGIECIHIREKSDIPSAIDGRPPIVICNYERLNKLDVSSFGAVVLDESSILKSFTGTTKRQLVELFKDTPYRLAATATPAPNDNMEIGQHAEFLGIMRSPEMLSRWFISDQTTMGGYRLKSHARDNFWEWVASWSRCASLPSDLGGDDAGYILPDIDRRVHIVRRDITKDIPEGMLFAMPECSATSLHAEKRMTLQDRVEMAAELATTGNPVTIWCERNDESCMLADMIDGAVEVHGGMSADAKEKALEGFSKGDFRAIVTKPKISGFGVNWQHCAHAVFASVSYSYEEHYQAVRRSHRFGQTRRVVNDVVVADTELAVWTALNGKASGHEEMKRQMQLCMRRAQGHEPILRRPYQSRHYNPPKFLNQTSQSNIINLTGAA